MEKFDFFSAQDIPQRFPSETIYFATIFYYPKSYYKMILSDQCLCYLFFPKVSEKNIRKKLVCLCNKTTRQKLTRKYPYLNIYFYCIISSSLIICAIVQLLKRFRHIYLSSFSKQDPFFRIKRLFSL